MTDHPPPDITDLLRDARFLQDISADDLDKLAAIARIEQVDAATVLFQEGSRCERLYLVASGLIGLDMCMPRRGCVRILTVGEGEFLGWSALLGNAAMTARATVLESGTLVAFSADALRELCDCDHDVGYAIMRQISQALSQRLLATRLQMLDVFGQTSSAPTAHHSQAATTS
ncbi:transcriptional activator FtrB [Maioricimonas rarisocia]|uniref:Transcriptional activator FtrB n=1 Tax=Maioricimonas rarisocia TaxID=2528026 RepID=A0A517Z6L6_9PLAN|nr:Crp/Fnr family transcriptional regulator [Maioricimonas rarisocia]QDU38115.1 transcriptional activator FtrB [Maioricimonas rarisocia]